MNIDNHSVKLKPCPFCGGKAWTLCHADYWEKNAGVVSYVGCTECKARSDLFANMDDAIAAWNRRANDE